MGITQKTSSRNVMLATNAFSFTLKQVSFSDRPFCVLTLKKRHGGTLAWTFCLESMVYKFLEPLILLFDYAFILVASCSTCAPPLPPRHYNQSRKRAIVKLRIVYNDYVPARTIGAHFANYWPSLSKGTTAICTTLPRTAGTGHAVGMSLPQRNSYDKVAPPPPPYSYCSVKFYFSAVLVATALSFLAFKQGH